MDKKTGKREYAFVFVVLICFLVYKGEAEILKIVIWPFITFIAAAAGLHIYDKSLGNLRIPTSTPAVMLDPREGSPRQPEQQWT